MKRYLLLSVFIISILIANKAKAGCKAEFDILKDSIISSSPYAYLFIDKSTGVNIISWEWDFGDGNTSTEHFPLHKYDKPGKYNVCLTIKTKNNGVIDCQDKLCKELTVEAIQPVTCLASFYYYIKPDAQGGVNTYYFTDNSGGQIINRYWDFGDGGKSTLTNPTHTFAPGTYEICLTVEGLMQDSVTICQDKYCTYITVKQSSLCYADFYTSADSVNKLKFSFADISTGNPDLWFWSFGDNTISNEKNPVHIYSTPGKYQVCLTIKNEGIDCKDFICYEILAGVSPSDCEAGFYYNPENSQEDKFIYNFINISKGSATSFLWNFGDGEISLDENPEHEYLNPGVYNVCLTISDTNNTGCNDTYCQTIFIENKPSTCKAQFSAKPDSTDISMLKFEFTDKSTGSPDKWHWNFGDNTTDSVQNPTHTYKQAGKYYICLTIINNATNCKDIFCMTIYAGEEQYYCHAEFSYMKDETTVSMPYSEIYYFTDNSKGDIGCRYWEFGDGTTSKEQNPMHMFYPGNYKICLTISGKSDFGAPCSDTYCTILIVDSAGATPPVICNNYITHKNDAKDSLSVHFYGSSYYGEQPITYEWDFGDGKTSSEQNPLHKYTAKGTYTVSLTTKDALNCTFTSTQTIFVGTSEDYGEISGQVFAGINNADKCKVIIASWDNSSNYFTYLDTTYVDIYGSYDFKKVPFGKYYVFAALMKDSKYFNEFLPTFYGDKWDWVDATQADVSITPSSTQYDIHLIPYKNFSTGPGSIEGYVTYGGVKPYKKNQSLAGIEVLLFDMDDKPLDLQYTDGQGYFRFPNLAYGTYKVYVEILGIYSTAALVTISEEKENAKDIGFNLDSKILPFVINASVKENSNADIAMAGNIFPNPASDRASIAVTLAERTKITISVFNELGQMIESTVQTKGRGKSFITLNTSGLKHGLYNVLINFNERETVTRRLLKD